MLKCLQKPATGPYPEASESNAQLPTLFLQDPFYNSPNLRLSLLRVLFSKILYAFFSYSLPCDSVVLGTQCAVSQQKSQCILLQTLIQRNDYNDDFHVIFCFAV